MSVLSKNNKGGQRSLESDSKDRVLDSDLLSLVGLDEGDVFSDESNDLEPEFEDIEDEGEEEHTELKFHEQGWVQAGAMGLAVGLVTVFTGTFLSSSFGIGREEKPVKAELNKNKKTDAEERGFLDKTAEEKDKELSRLQAERAMINQRYQARLLELQREQQLAVNAQQSKADNQEAEELRKKLLARKKSQELEKIPEPPEVVVPPPPQISPSTENLLSQNQVNNNLVNDIDYRNQWQMVQEMWRLQQELGSFGKGDTTPVLKAELSNQTTNFSWGENG